MCTESLPKLAKKEAVYFFERGADDAHESEVLLWAILVVACGHYSPSELREWAQGVRGELRQV